MINRFVTLFVLIVKEIKKLKEDNPSSFYSEKIKYLVYHEYHEYILRYHDIKCFLGQWFYSYSGT